MSMSYTQETMLHSLAARAAIEDLDARHGRAYEEGDADAWVSTFTHSGASFQRAGEEPLRGSGLRTAFEAWKGRVHLTFDQVVAVDGVQATQECRLLVLTQGVDGDRVVEATGRYHDELVYERGAWYLHTRRVMLDGAAAAGR